MDRCHCAVSGATAKLGSSGILRLSLSVKEARKVGRDERGRAVWEWSRRVPSGPALRLLFAVVRHHVMPSSEVTPPAFTKKQGKDLKQRLAPTRSGERDYIYFEDRRTRLFTAAQHSQATDACVTVHRSKLSC
jgi:hypothetical protein